MNHFFLDAHRLLSLSQKRKGVWIIIALVISSLLDFFSLASFLPLIFLLINPQQAMANQQIAGFYNALGFTDPLNFALALTLTALVFIFIKTQVNIRITYQKAQYAYQIASNLASRALTRYFHSSYTQFTGTDFTKEMNRIANLPLSFANNIIIPAGTVLSELVVLLLLLTGIAVYNINVLLFLFLMIIPVAVIYVLKRKNIKQTGQKLKKTYPLLLKYTLQAVEAFPEIRVFRKEAFFKDKFNTTYDELGKTLSKDHTSHTSASRTTELVAALCITTLIGYAVISRLPYSDTLVLLSIYAGVSFRAIPSINRIFAASLQMRQNEHVVEELSQIVAPQEDNFSEALAPLSFRDKIELSNITFGYETQPPILRNASLQISKGDKIILAGKSGTGKTTLLYLLLRFLKEQQGEIKADGVKLTDQNTLAWRKLIGYVPQNPYILDTSIAGNIAFGIAPEKTDRNKINQLIQAMDLQTWVDTLPDKIDTVIGERGAKISGGQRQRLAIARALYHDAEILLLDEITNQLDRQTELEVMHTLGNFTFRDKTIILITHWPELWKSFSLVYELREGKFEKTTRETLQTSF